MSLYLGTTPIANDGSHRLTGEIGDMGFAPLGIDESLNLRRYLNGQVISQTQFEAFTNKVKSAVALFPNLATTESNWQSEKALSKFGQVGKFVVDDTAGTIRLPAVVNAQGLLGLSGIGNLVSESLPNISGSTAAALATTTAATPVGAIYASSSSGNPLVAGGTSYGSLAWNLDASRSSSTYQNNAPVQQEAVQYPYYIQVATGVEETLPAIREYKVNNSDYFGKSMYSDIAPDNASWLASNGQYNARSVYPDYYDWLNGKIGQVITANGGKAVLSTGTITDYDFVVNQNDQTFRLPLKNGCENIPDWANVQNIASNVPFTAPSDGWIYGAGTFTGDARYRLNNIPVGVASGTSGWASYGTVAVRVKKGDVFNSDASFQNFGLNFIPAVGNGTLYYYVGDTIQDASLINAGAVLGQLNNKVDIDASNFNADGKSLLSGLSCMSNGVLISKSFATSTKFTAPDNGWFKFRGVSTASPSRCFMANVSVQGVPAVGGDDNASGSLANIMLRVKKGDRVSFQYTNLNIAYDESSGAWFYPDVGEI